MSTRDAETKGGSLESGTSHKQSFHSTDPASLGMGTVQGNSMTGSQKPAGNPSKKVARGHTLK
jgi:hypothetical protein